MSWSGPVAGAAPHQPPPYANGQPGYSQPGYGQQNHPYRYSSGYRQYQSGSTYPHTGPLQPSSDNRPPKKKGNPIITRYPPPPGYRGPAQAQPPFGTGQYGNQQQLHHPGFSQAAHSQPGYHMHHPNQGYPPQNFTAPQPPAYASPSYPHAQGYQWPQQGFHLAPNYPQPSFPHGGQGCVPPQSGHQHHHPQSGPADPRKQAFNEGPGLHQSNSQFSQPVVNPQNAYSSSLPGSDQPMVDSSATPTAATADLASAHPAMASSQLTGNPKDHSSKGKTKLFLGWDDWDFDFEGAIWPKSNEPVDPSLSLGVIVWHPAKQVTRALPSTFFEAEEQALKPVPDQLGNGESVSIYFTTENSHEAFLNVRQMEEWDAIRDDPVFVVFTDDDLNHHLVTLEDCIAQRDRSDEPLGTIKKAEDGVTDEVNWSVMDNLDQALSAGGRDAKPNPVSRELRPSQGQTQEDILAMLGVTGSPKPLIDNHRSFSTSTTDEKPPVSLPGKLSAPRSSSVSRSQPPPQRAQSMGGPPNIAHQNVLSRPYGSMSSAVSSRPPLPPPPSEHQGHDPWNPTSKQTHHLSSGFAGFRTSPAPSEGSNGTMAGSDFESEKPTDEGLEVSAPAPHLHRSDSSFSRKRSHEDTDRDDHTKRKRRSLVDAAYSRR